MGTGYDVTPFLGDSGIDGRSLKPLLDDPAAAFVSRYALGRDYHKLLRGRLRGVAARRAKRGRV